MKKSKRAQEGTQERLEHQAFPDWFNIASWLQPNSNPHQSLNSNLSLNLTVNLLSDA